MGTGRTKSPGFPPSSPSFSSHVQSIIRGCQVYLLTSTEPVSFSPPAPTAIAQGQAATLSALDNYRRPPSRLPGATLASLQLVLCVPARGTSDNINLNLPPSLHPCLKPLIVLRTKEKLLSAALIQFPLAHCLTPGCWPSSPPTLSVTGPLHMPFRLPGIPFPSACPLGVSALAGFPQGSGVLPFPEYRPFPPGAFQGPMPSLSHASHYNNF